MDFKNNSNKSNKSNKSNNQNNQNKQKDLDLDLEKEKTRQLELIKDIKKLELKLKNNKKYKHTKKYIDLSSILNDDNESVNSSDNDDSVNSSDNDIDNEHYDTISVQSTKSITTIDYIDLLS